MVGEMLSAIPAPTTWCWNCNLPHLLEKLSHFHMYRFKGTHILGEKNLLLIGECEILLFRLPVVPLNTIFIVCGSFAYLFIPLRIRDIYDLKSTLFGSFVASTISSHSVYI